MAKILDRLPIPPRDDMTFVREELVRLKEPEIIVGVSLSPKTVLSLNANTPGFPAILDRASNGSFSRR